MTTKLIIDTSSGLCFSGAVNISGAKNAALPEIAAALLTDQAVTLNSVPYLTDVASMITVIASMGAEVSLASDRILCINSGTIASKVVAKQWVRKIRASILLLGPLLARNGYAELALPGGCAIGARPIMEHIAGLKALGATVTIENDLIVAKAKALVGANIKMESISVGATENLIMAAVLAAGDTTIDNAACEPEVVDLATMLNNMGAKISGHGSSTINITGVASLNAVEHTVMPDRIEAGTILIAAAAARGKVKLSNCPISSMTAVLQCLTAAGANITVEKDQLTLDMAGKRPRAVSLTTAVYPGFPTDLQAQWSALAAVSVGECKITETIFDNRFNHVPELQKMAANIARDADSIIINGIANLSANSVTATDLRAAAALIIAAIAAEGITEISNAFYLDRGYDNLEQKLGLCGVKMFRELSNVG